MIYPFRVPPTRSRLHKRTGKNVRNWIKITTKRNLQIDMKVNKINTISSQISMAGIYMHANKTFDKLGLNVI